MRRSGIFGPAQDWPDQDLIAFSSGLDPALTLDAYRSGVFPMPLERSGFDHIGWWSPLRRGVLPLGGSRDPDDIASRAEAPPFRMIDQHDPHAGVLAPVEQRTRHRLDHVQVERMERARAVEAEAARIWASVRARSLSGRAATSRPIASGRGRGLVIGPNRRTGRGGGKGVPGARRSVLPRRGKLLPRLHRWSTPLAA